MSRWPALFGDASVSLRQRGRMVDVVHVACCDVRTFRESIVHSSGEYCVIAPDVQIGDGTRVGNFVYIRGNTHIGEGCVIGSYVDIEGDVTIGSHVSLQSACYLT